jgi:archaellum biogenesis ATPase FlaH
MNSKLIIENVETLQGKINSVVGSFENIPGIYICLNKTQKGTEVIFKEEGIKIDKLFFIDCVTSEKSRSDVLHIDPHQLEILNSAIHNFINDINGEKILIIDALSTLLIYNEEDNVVNFVRDLIDFASRNNTKIIAFSPITRGEELLNRIFYFFDDVEKVGIIVN